MTAAEANADQIAYWNGVAGEKWTTAQERLDADLVHAMDELVVGIAPRRALGVVVDARVGADEHQ